MRTCSVRAGPRISPSRRRQAKATAKPGYSFQNWTESGIVASASATYVFSSSSDRTLVANFVASGPTTLTLGGATGQVGNYVTIAASLKNKLANSYVAGESVQFTMDGVSIGSGVTNVNGRASYRFIIAEGSAVGSHPIVATFAGDAGLLASTSSNTLNVAKGVSKFISFASVSAKAGTTVNLTAKLANQTNSPIVGASVEFKVAGVVVGTAISDTNGVATLPYSIAVGTPIANYSLLATFYGDAGHTGITKTATLSVK